MEANNLTEDAIRLAEQSEELKAFFKPSESYTDYERMVSDAADWAMDNYEAEGWSPLSSFTCELANQLSELCDADINAVWDTMHKIYNN